MCRNVNMRLTEAQIRESKVATVVNERAPVALNWDPLISRRSRTRAAGQTMEGVYMDNTRKHTEDGLCSKTTKKLGSADLRWQRSLS